MSGYPVGYALLGMPYGGRVFIESKMITPQGQYLAIAEAPGGLIGYNVMNGSMLISMVSNLTELANFVKSILKPINEYGKTTFTIYVKSPSGEYVGNGTVCLVNPLMPFGPRPLFVPGRLGLGAASCSKVVNGEATFSNVYALPYIVVYWNMLKVSSPTIQYTKVGTLTINIYGIKVNVTKYMVVMNITEPSFILLFGKSLILWNETKATVTVTALSMGPRAPAYIVQQPSQAVSASTVQSTTTTQSSSNSLQSFDEQLLSILNVTTTETTSTPISVSTSLTSTTQPIEATYLYAAILAIAAIAGGSALMIAVIRALEKRQ